MSYFVAHFRKSCFFFYLLSLRATRMFVNTVLGFIYEVLLLLLKSLLHVFRLFVWLIVQIYMAKRFIFDRQKKHRNPLSKQNSLEKSLHVHSINRRRDVICLALDKTLVYVQTKPPPKGQNAEPIQVSQINGKTVRYFVKSRPFLKEFLDVVRLVVCPPFQSDSFYSTKRKCSRGNHQ